MDVKDVLKGNIDNNMLSDKKTWSSNKINENINTKMDKEEKVITKIEATKWQGNIYSFEDVYPSSQYNLLLKKSFSATEEQTLAWIKASFDEDDDLNRLRANGEIPKVDIPIVLILHKK